MLVHNSSERSSLGEEKEDHGWTPQILTRDGAMCERKQIIKIRIRKKAIKNVLVATSDGSVASTITRVYRSYHVTSPLASNSLVEPRRRSPEIYFISGPINS